ncbi:TolC family protein [Algoriphagus antarcticus]|uniref:Outer membrane protein TolC n=1 Tax=Algoriphagus antarcticus TaxID=238540 RepID=A0A3E0DK98_9BACT|nr:TolC family protein [Algoriphagus antarcticus]REG82512.1 outer membrane protein TolC [Algoriphagus antarcticus]
MKRLFMYKKYVILLIAVLIAGKIQAQDTVKINFRQAVDLALSTNVDYQIQSNNLEVLKLQKQSAFLSHLPNANINSSFSQQTGQQFQQIEGEIVVTNVTNEVVNAGLSMNMPIFNSGRRILDTQSSKLAYEAGEKGLDRASQQVMFDVSRRYLQVLLDEELVRISKENLENQKEQLRQIEGFLDAGLRTISDKYNQQSEVARLESVLVDAELQFQNDLWDLSEYLQLEAGVMPVLESVDPRSDELRFEGMSMTELYEMAQANRADGKQQELLQTSFKKDMQAIKAMYYPRIGAFYNYNTFFTSLDDRNLQDQLFDVYPQNTLGLSLSIPIFNNFQNRLEVGRSRVAYKNQILQKESVDRKIYQDVKLAHLNYMAAVKKEGNTGIQVMAAVEAQKAISERFRLGISNFVDLATANQQLVNAQADQAQAVYTLFFQEVLMQHALGTLEVLD